MRVQEPTAVPQVADAKVPNAVAPQLEDVFPVDDELQPIDVHLSELVCALYPTQVVYELLLPAL